MKKLNIVDIKLYRVIVGKVRAVATVFFDGFMLKGFKILEDEEKGKLFVTPPSYQTKYGWRQSFRTDSEEDWKEIQHRILETYENYEFEGETLTEDPEKDPF